MAVTVATPKDYWISQQALSITLNALGEPNRIQASVASGAAILCYVRGVKPASSGQEYAKNGDGLEYDNGHNYRHWPITISPTFFNSDTEKYLYIAIPRSASVGTDAMVVFPSEKLDIYGYSIKQAPVIDDEGKMHDADGNETDDPAIAVKEEQQDTLVGSENYFYIWLQGIISEPTEIDGILQRQWSAHVDCGTLSTDEAFSTLDSDWYSYSTIDQIVSFLKEILMKSGSSFINLILNHKELTDVATSKLTAPVDSDKMIATPNYVQKFFISKIKDDIANGIITFVKGIKIGAQKIFGWDENGNILANRLSLSLEAKINEIRSHNNNGSGMFEGGWFVTNNHNGHSYLEVDELLVRMKAVFAELEIRKETHSGGNVFYSPAGSVIYRVEYYKYDTEHPGEVIRLGITTVERRTPITAGGKMLSLLKSLGSKIGIFAYDKTIVTEVPVDHSQVDFYRCYLIADDGTVQTRNWWHANDQARCQTFNRASQKAETGQSDAPDVVISEQNNYIQDQMDGNRFYWRLVLKAGTKKLEDGKWYDYVDLSNQEAGIGYVTGSDYPAAGDTIVCIGNRSNPERMNLVMLEVIGDDAPAIKMYRGVNSFSFDGKKFWHIGNKLQFRADSIEYVTGNGQVLPPKLSLGPWVIGQRYHYYEEVSHNGSLWLCNIIDGYRWEKADGTFIMDEMSPVFADEGTFAYGSNLQFTEHYYNTMEYEVENEVVTIYLVRKYTTAEPSDNTDSWSVEVAKGEPGHVELTDADKDDIASRVTNLPAGYTLCINPEPIFIDQNEPGLISFYQGNTYYYFADVTVYDHNGNELPVTINSNDAKAYGRSGNSYVEMRTVPPVVINNSRIALSGIDSHPTTAGAYEYDFDNGYIDFTIVIQKTQEESVTIEHQKVCWYLNQLGSRIVKVVGDVSETYMSKTSYSTDKAQNNAALRTDYEGKITESASGLDAKFTTITDDIATDVAELEITAKGLKSSVTSSNLENLVDNTGWKSWADNSSAIYDADTMKVTNLPNENELYSSAIFLEKNKTYVFSLYTNEDFDMEEGNQVIRFYMCGDDPDAIPSSMLEEPIASPVSTIASDVYQNQKRRYCTIQPDSAEYYKIEVYGPTSFYRAKMESGSVPTSWYATSSEIKQTADEIKLSVKDDLMETGIDITNNTIHMRAENTIIDSDVSVGSLETIGENSRVRIKEGVAEFFGVAGIANIRIGLDSQGCAILNFYDNGGNFVYGLGPNDLPSQLNSKASAFSLTESIVIFDVSSLNNTLSHVSSLAALSSGFATFYLFVEGYSALNNVKTYLVSGTTTPSSYNKKAYDSNGKSSNGDNWHPTGTEITAGYYVGVARANGNYTGSAPSLYKCRDVYYVASTGSPVVFIGTLYYKYDNLKGQLTNMTGTKTYPYNSDRYLIDYLDGNDGERPRI